MKKLSRAVMVLFVFLLWPKTILAQQEDELDALPSIQETDITSGEFLFSLEQLGRNDISLAPQEESNIAFRLPASWTFPEDSDVDLSVLNLRYNLVLSDDIQDAQDVDFPDLTISVDGNVISNVEPRPGSDQVITAVVPSDAWNSESSYHTIIFEYGRESIRCGFEEPEFQLEILQQSNVLLRYQSQLVPLDLRGFPNTLVQNSFLPEKLSVVLPEEPNLAEINAAAIVAAVVGDSTNGAVTVSAIDDSQVTDELLNTSSVVTIGSPVRNGFTQTLYDDNLLPTRFNSEELLLDEPIPETTGIIQLTRSPQNSVFTVMAITGLSDEAVEKAALALLEFEPSFGAVGPVAVVEDVNRGESPPVEAPVTTFTLEELNFNDSTIYGLGEIQRTVRFFLPGDVRIANNANLLLNYAHSSNLEDVTIGINVEINNTLIGSAPISEDNMGSQEVTIPIPVSLLERGQENKIVIEVITESIEVCANADSRATWVQVNDSSTITLPFIPLNADELPVLAGPIDPLVSQDSVWLVIPDSPSFVDIEQAIQISWLLGKEGQVSGTINPTVILGDTEDIGSKITRGNTVLLGRPTTNSFIQEINSYLPQPFVEGGDNLSQQIGNIQYRLPDDFDIGIVEVIPAPWNQSQVAVIVSGTTEQGVIWSHNALVDETIFWALDGDVSFISGETAEDVESISTRTLPVVPLEVSVEDLTEEDVELDVTEEDTSATEPSSDSQPASVLPDIPLLYIWLGMAAVVLIGGVGIYLRLRSKTSA